MQATPLHPSCAAIVFDFDGVIVASNAIKDEAYAELYRPHGPEIEAAVLDFHRRNGGLSRTLKLRHFEEAILGRSPDEARIADLAERFSGLVEEAVGRSAPIPGALEFVRRHTGALPLFLASGTPEDELQRIVARRGWTSWFVEVRGSPAHKTELVADILRRHRLDPARVPLVGDSPTDLEAARANGLPFLGIVPPGEESLFPPDTPVRPDLTDLEPAINALL